MNTEQNTAFIDTPPEGFAPWSTKTLKTVRMVCIEAGLDMATIPDAQLYGAYSLVSQGNYTPDKAQIIEAWMEIPDDVVPRLESYINRVVEREAAAEVETETEGKP